MEALFSADVAWSPTDLAEADHPGAVIRMLDAASGAQVVRLEAGGGEGHSPGGAPTRYRGRLVRRSGPGRGGRTGHRAQRQKVRGSARPYPEGLLPTVAHRDLAEPLGFRPPET